MQLAEGRSELLTIEKITWEHLALLSKKHLVELEKLVVSLVGRHVNPWTFPPKGDKEVEYLKVCLQLCAQKRAWESTFLLSTFSWRSLLGVLGSASGADMIGFSERAIAAQISRWQVGDVARFWYLMSCQKEEAVFPDVSAKEFCILWTCPPCRHGICARLWAF